MSDGLLYCPEDAYAVHVLQSEPLLTLQTAVLRPSSIGRVLSYYKKVGSLARLTRKIVSRQIGRGAERKVVLVGVGEIVPEVGLAEDGEGAFYGGERVLFLATRADEHAPVVLVSPLLVRAFDTPLAPLATALRADGELFSILTAHLAGWSVYSGISLTKKQCQRVMRALVALASSSTSASIAHPQPKPRSDERPRVVVFGAGHYARTCLFPNLEAHYELWRVHEIDPLLREELARVMPGVVASGSPWPEPEDGDGASMWCVAGYHHHHTRQVCEALDEQIDVMVEKPLVVSRQGLREVLAALDESAARIYQGFHRRTWQPSEWIKKDLEIQRGSSAVHYHTVAHEVSLPPHHWYRWPSSGSRLVVNGCHWLDEFLFWNGYRPWTRAHATSMCDGEVWTVQVQLDHGATFSMTLSSAGSDRLGVRETTSIHCEGRSARIVDNLYTSEDGERELRRARILEEQTYQRMVDAIAACQMDQREKLGDDAAAIARLWELVFTLEERVRKR